MVTSKMAKDSGVNLAKVKINNEWRTNILDNLFIELYLYR